MATTLGSVAVDSIVYLKESGTAVPFYVAKHDYESALNGAGRTLLVRKDCYNKGAWGASGAGNEYSGSTIDKLFETTYRNLLDGFVQEALVPTTIYYTPGGGGLGDDHPISTINRSIFALSLTELGLSYSPMSNVEGTALPIADTLRIANYNGSAVNQWTRSRALNNETSALCSSTAGKANGYSATATGPARRPALTLPAEMGVDDSGNVTEPVAQILHGSMINNVLCVTKKCYAMIDGVLCAVPYGLANIDGVMTKIQFEEPEPPAPPVQTYTVTIGTETPGYGYAGVAYFKINGKEYTGASAQTLTVNEGTAWYAQIGSGGGGQIFVNGKNISKQSTEGTVTSNMTVKINGYTIPGQTIPVFQIYITTS